MKIGKYDVTPSSIGSYIRGTSKKYLDSLDVTSLPDHEASQVILRATLCSDCLIEGQCKGPCNCKTPDMFYDPKKKCDAGKWGEMMPKDEWEKFASEIMSMYATTYSNNYKFRNRVKNTEQTTIVFQTSGTEHDFKEVMFNKPLSHKFVFKNTTGLELQIRTVQPSCRCTTPSFISKPVKPNESFEITMKYDNDAVGVFRKTAAVHFTNPRVTPITLMIKGVAKSK